MNLQHSVWIEVLLLAMRHCCWNEELLSNLKYWLNPKKMKRNYENETNLMASLSKNLAT